MSATKVFSCRFPEDLVVEIEAKVGPRGRNAFLVEAARAALGLEVEISVGSNLQKVHIAPEPQKKLDDLPAGQALARRAEGQIRQAYRDRAAAEDQGAAALPSDQAELLALVKRGPVMSRVAEDHFGWLGLRYRKAENALLSRDLIRFESGMLVSCI